MSVLLNFADYISEKYEGVCYALDLRWERGMKLVAEYLEDALNLDKLADAEKTDQVRDVLRKQAAGYRYLASRRAKHLGPLPDILDD